MCTATARARRCASGSRRSSTRRRWRRDARWSSASLRASAERALKLDAVAAKAGFDKTEEFFAAFARDDINSQAGADRDPCGRGARRARRTPSPSRKSPRGRARRQGAGSGILVVGVDRLLTGLARCCKPAPPDPIVGFVTRGKGVTIHRAICSNVASMRATQPERLITANWGAPRDEVFPVDIVVEAMDRQGLLRDISEVLSREKINVTAANTLTQATCIRAWRSRWKCAVSMR